MLYKRKERVVGRREGTRREAGYQATDMGMTGKREKKTTLQKRGKDSSSTRNELYGGGQKKKKA